jgi:hypothetical protein
VIVAGRRAHLHLRRRHRLRLHRPHRELL